MMIKTLLCPPTSLQTQTLCGIVLVLSSISVQPSTKLLQFRGFGSGEWRLKCHQRWWDLWPRPLWSDPAHRLLKDLLWEPFRRENINLVAVEEVLCCRWCETSELNMSGILHVSVGRRKNVNTHTHTHTAYAFFKYICLNLITHTWF